MVFENPCCTLTVFRTRIMCISSINATQGELNNVFIKHYILQYVQVNDGRTAGLRRSDTGEPYGKGYNFGKHGGRVREIVRR